MNEVDGKKEKFDGGFAMATQYTPLNELDSFMQGALNERVGVAMAEVAKNILDVNTDPAKARKITVDFTVKPNKDRTSAEVSLSVKTTLAGNLPVETSVAVGKDEHGQLVLAEKTNQVPGQIDIYGNEIRPNVIAMPSK